MYFSYSVYELDLSMISVYLCFIYAYTSFTVILSVKIIVKDM
jgi:hypothetical protein